MPIVASSICSGDWGEDREGRARLWSIGRGVHDKQVCTGVYKGRRW